jgi:RNA polymerase sigma-70 factor (ECF subfamily)
LDEHIAHELVALLPRLRRFARGLTGTADRADDLVQAACERAIERIDQWRAGSRLDSWMYRIIQTLHLDQIRREGTVKRHIALVVDHQDRAVDGAEVAETRLTLDHVRRVVEEMPEQYRTVLLLVCVEGLSYRETAETLGVPAGTVMSRLARARATINGALEQDGAQAAEGNPAKRG